MRKAFNVATIALAGVLGAASTATAQGTSEVWDANQLPQTTGTVKQYTLTPRGEVDGLILVDGTEVKMPPHLTGELVFTVRPGDAVTIKGLKARALLLIDAASITNDATGKSVSDVGPSDGPDHQDVEQTVSGTIAAPLHGKRGEVNGVLLEDGMVVRFPPPEAERLASFLQSGQPLSVRGNLMTLSLGKVIEARAMGPSVDRLSEVDAPAPPRPKPPHANAGPGGDDGPPPPPPPLPRG